MWDGAGMFQIENALAEARYCICPQFLQMMQKVKPMNVE